MDIKTRFNIGEEFFFLNARKISKFVVEKISIEVESASKITIKYMIKSTYIVSPDKDFKRINDVSESYMHKSKEELLNSL